MFGLSKAIVTRALVVAIWGATLSAPQAIAADASASPEAPAGAVWVTGSVQQADGVCSQVSSSSQDGVGRATYECDQTWTASDPRLTGEVSSQWSEDAHQTDEGVMAVGIDARYLQNEAGSWACTAAYVAKDVTPAEVLADPTFTCVGDGGYAGLTAVLVLEAHVGDQFSGLIFSGDLPPAPAALPTE